ncbi:MFS transporter [Pseudonocardia endophytica]|uniref:MFS transporter n=1 Tax=Pseudonocardia endophytica TaxID=401976 RepID=A0A4R1HJI8_PSEEN|nr:MFS transporter [Pseudonocardia endophytica]TCK21151.1 MFS transporter [Pseudonocardia endophytica]
MLFANGRFRRLFTAQVVALVGTGLTTVALGLLAYDLAGSRAALVLGTALAVKMVAYVVVSPLVGAIADRVPRRRIMIAADLTRAGVVLVLPWVTQVWQVYALIAVLQAASASFTPVFQSVLPDVLPDEEGYTRALSASQVAVSLENVLSPLLAAAALAVTTYSTLFVGTAVGFLGSAALVLATAVPAAQRAQGRFADRLSLGLRLFRSTPQLRGLLALNMVVAATGAISLVTTVNVVRDLLGAGESAVGLLLAAAGAGTALAAVSAPAVSRRLPDRSVMLGGAVLALGATTAALLLAALPSWPLAVVAWALIGFGPGWITVTTGRLLRGSSGPAQRPALFSAQFSLSHACWLITYPLTGWLAASAGFGVAWGVLAVLALAGAGIAVALWPVRGGDLVRHRHDDVSEHVRLATTHRSGRGWTHAHRVVVDGDHPHGPVPA